MPSATVLELTTFGGACMSGGGRRSETVLERVETLETAESVTVTAFVSVRDPLPDGQPCADVGLSLPVVVQLKNPLGKRLLLDGACPEPGIVGSLDGGDSCAKPKSAQPAPAAVGAWQRFDAGPLLTRGEGTAVWTGSEVLVVGGLILDQYLAVADGAAFNPSSGTWRPIPAVPGGGRLMTSAWTGREMIVGGIAGSNLNPAQDMSVWVAFDPAVNAWRSVAPPPRSAVNAKLMTVGGSVVLFNGGGRDAAWCAVYDEAADRWRELPGPPVSVLAMANASVGGSTILALASTVPATGGPTELRIASLDPVAAAWTLSSVGPLGVPQAASVVGTVQGAVVRTDVISDSTWRWDRARDEWKRLPATLTESGGVAAGGPVASLVDGTVLGVFRDVTDPVRVLPPGANQWVTAGVPPGPMTGGLVVSIGDGMFLFGVQTVNGMAQVREPNGAMAWRGP